MQRKNIIAVAAVVVLAAGGGVAVALLWPRPNAAAPAPPPSPAVKPAHSDAEYLGVATDIRFPHLVQFFSVDFDSAEAHGRAATVRADFKRVLGIELSDADLARIKAETRGAWFARKQEARLLLDQFMVGKLDKDQLWAQTRHLMLAFGDDDFRKAARITAEQFTKLREDAMAPHP